MKAVDVIGIFDRFQVWIEIKNSFQNSDIAKFVKNPNDKGSRKNKGLKSYLDDVKFKFRDTFLYRHCEDKLYLPIVYIFLTNFQDDLCLICQQVLKKDIPTGKVNSSRWSKELLDGDWLFVVNINKWNKDLSYIGSCTNTKKP